MTTDKQIEANRANAQLSTGPTSSEGKAKSSLNGLKTALTGRTILHPEDDVAAYQAHVARIAAKYKEAATDDERLLVQSIADTQWRLQRIPLLEAAYFGMGQLEFAELFPEQPADVRSALIQAKTHDRYFRQLSNLAIQEGRLSRKLEKETAALEALLEPRRTAYRRQLGEAVNTHLHHQQEQYGLAHWRALGFGFSTDEWLDRLTESIVARDKSYATEILRVTTRRDLQSKLEQG